MPQSAPAPAGAKWRILSIDDDPDVLGILKITLGTKHEIVTANDGVEGMCMLDLCDPDFIICDVCMPNMNGFQTVSAIRRHPKYHDIPVFFLTAEADRESAKKGFASGANLYLTKPFEPMRVLQNIDFFLKEHGRQPSSKRLTIDGIEKEMERLSQPAAQPPLSTPAQEDKNTRITIISQAPDQVRRVHGALCAKYECVTCADPLASLQKLFRYDPDILVVNPAIPHLSGLGFVQMIRQNPKLRMLPIVLMQDRSQPFDQRLVPSITKHPVLSPSPTEGEIAKAIQSAIHAPAFFIRPKRSTIDQLLNEERKQQVALQQEQARLERQAERTRGRYARIQQFIDKNMR